MPTPPTLPTPSERKLFATGALILSFGVIFGAFGAHVLKGRLSNRELEIFHTAVFYQLTQSLGLMLLLLAGTLTYLPRKSAHRSARALLVGIFIFSGSLYALVATGISKFGAITPLGGVAFIFAWLSAGFAAFMTGRVGPGESSD